MCEHDSVKSKCEGRQHIFEQEADETQRSMVIPCIVTLVRDLLDQGVLHSDSISPVP